MATRRARRTSRPRSRPRSNLARANTGAPTRRRRRAGSGGSKSLALDLGAPVAVAAAAGYMGAATGEEGYPLLGLVGVAGTAAAVLGTGKTREWGFRAGLGGLCGAVAISAAAKGEEARLERLEEDARRDAEKASE